MMGWKGMQENDRWAVALDFVEDVRVIAPQAVHRDLGYQTSIVKLSSVSCQFSDCALSFNVECLFLPHHGLLGLNDDRRQTGLLRNDDPGEDVRDYAGEASRRER